MLKIALGDSLASFDPHYDGHYSMIQCYNEEGYCLAGYVDLADYRVEKDHFWYCPSFDILPRHITDDGCLAFVRVDRDLSQPGTVLSYAHENLPA